MGLFRLTLHVVEDRDDDDGIWCYKYLQLSFGEAQSLWRLLRDPEFLVLFIFQHSYAIPRLESTCGGIFMHSYPKVRLRYHATLSCLVMSVYL